MDWVFFNYPDRDFSWGGRRNVKEKLLNKVWFQKGVLRRDGAGEAVMGMKQRQGFHVWCFG